VTSLVGSDHAARVLLDLSAWGFAASEISIRLRSGLHRDGDRKDRGSLVAIVVSLVAGAVLAVAATRVEATTISGWPPVVVGVVLMWLGVALRQWAVWTLGRFFTVVVRVSDGQTVVEGGPYRWVRHPSYTGLLLTLLGLGFALGNWLSALALVVVPMVGVVVRIRIEERALLDGLGEPYRTYAEGRRRLVPGVW
jgi:protein-S-isoprenylcysteine O-methyltransferase Ste14